MKKILAIMPKSIGGRLTTESLIAGFIDNGFEVSIFDELKDKKLPRNDFSYIVGYDFSPIKIKYDSNLKIPCIAYFSDVIESKASGVLEDWGKYYKYLKNDDNFVFYWDRVLAQNDGWFYMPHFVNLSVYRDFLTPEFDVLFPGRLDSNLRLETYLNLNKLLPHVTFRFCAIEKHYLDALSRCKSELDRKIIKKTYLGFIDNEKDMAKMINKTKIVYNINSQGVSSLNYRSIQTLACKRLLISDNRAELDLFQGIIPIWDNINDLAKKIQYYLKNSVEYEKITKKAFRIIKSNHDCRICVSKMLNLIENYN